MVERHAKFPGALGAETARQQANLQKQIVQIQTDLIELAHDAILVRDPTSVIVTWNRGAEELYGWSAQEAVGKETHSLLNTQFPESREALDILLATGEKWQGELVHTHKNGTEIVVESRQVLIRDEQGQPGAILEINRDITERKRRERENQEQYRTIVQTANEGIWLVDGQAQTLYVNERMAKMLGYTTGEMVGSAVSDFVFPEDSSDIQVRIGNNLQGNFEQFDFRFRRKDGMSLYVLACTSPVRDGRGKITGALGMFTDLSVRKRTEEQAHFLAEVSKILSSSLDYQTTLANVAHLIVPQLADWFAVDLVNAEGQFELIEIDHKDPEMVQWARALREKYPIDYDAPTGTPNVVRTGQSELYADIPDEMLVAGSRTEEELAIARQIGYTSVMIVPLVARGKNIGVVSFVSAESGKHYDERDVALAEEVGRRAGIALDNARLYREVAQSRDQLEIILQGAADGIIVYARDGHIIFVNDAAARMSGFVSVDAMMQTTSSEIVAKYELIDENGQPFPVSQLAHKRVLRGERAAQATIGYRNLKKGQTQHWSFVSSRPVFDERGEVLFAITIMHDITERMLAERRKDEFINMASHELKTPVTSLKGFTHILQRRLSRQGDDQGLHYLSRIDAQLDKLTRLISDMLDISKMQSGKLDLQLESFDLDAFIYETVENLQAATSTHRLRIEGSTDAHIVGDRDRLGQVFINLLTNAIKYSPQANTVLVRLAREQDPERVIVSVQDFGIGIAEAHQQKIFERFYQVTDPEERTFPGLGIGLHIVQQIVERHHGRIWVESSKGQGAIFFVSIPLQRAA